MALASNVPGTAQRLGTRHDEGVFFMDRLRKLQQRNRAWMQQHPWKQSILMGIWFGIMMGVAGHIIDNDSIQASVIGGLIAAIVFTLV